MVFQLANPLRKGSCATDRQCLVLLFVFSGQEFFVLDEFRLLGCLSWKTGSTSWTLAFMNNTAVVPLGNAKQINYEDVSKFVPNVILTTHMLSSICQFIS